MVWFMGLIWYVDEFCKGGYYVGWVDVKIGELVDDNDVWYKYGEFIKVYIGIRFVELDMIIGYDLVCKEFL